MREEIADFKQVAPPRSFFGPSPLMPLDQNFGHFFKPSGALLFGAGGFFQSSPLIFVLQDAMFLKGSSTWACGPPEDHEKHFSRPLLSVA
jgi:hypothetical protein